METKNHTCIAGAFDPPDTRADFDVLSAPGNGPVQFGLTQSFQVINRCSCGACSSWRWTLANSGVGASAKSSASTSPKSAEVSPQTREAPL